MKARRPISARLRRAPRGQLTVVFALTFVVMIGAMALAVDLSALRSEVENAQRVANAAALAGVIFMPSYQPQAAFRAQEEARKNGFSNGQRGISITPSAVSGYPGRLRVTISEPVSLFFGRALGFGNRTISVSAVAEYFQPLQTGSPDNVLGYAPYPTKLNNPAAPEGFYLENKGQYTFKESGDAYTPFFESFSGPTFTAPGDPALPAAPLTNPCTDTAGGSGANGQCAYPAAPPCTVTTPCTVPNADNLTTNFQGYNYIIDDPISNTLTIKLFDPYDETTYNQAAQAYDAANHGLTPLAPADSNNASLGADSTAALTTTCPLGTNSGGACNNKFIEQTPAGSNPFTRNPANPTTLRFTLYGPGLSAVDANLPLVVTTTASATCPITSNCVYASPFNAGNDPTACPSTTTCSASQYAYRFFHYAVIHGPGIFRLNVSSVQNADGSYGTGGNAYGIAACNGSSTLGNTSDPYTNTATTVNLGWNPSSCADPNAASGKCANPAIPQQTDLCIHVYGLGKMSLHNWLGAGKSIIPLGFVPPQYAGKTLLVRLYDVGDVTKPAGCPAPCSSSLQVLSPAGTTSINNGNANGSDGYPSVLPYSYRASPSDGSSKSGLTGYRDTWLTPTSSATNPPIGTIDVTNSYYNGSWLNITVPLVSSGSTSSGACAGTSGYAGMVCNFGGYWKMLYDIGGAADDGTTWAMSIAGSPVHLVSGP